MKKTKPRFLARCKKRLEKLFFQNRRLKQLNMIKGYLGLKEGRLLFKIARSLKNNSIIVDPKKKIFVVEDPDDNKIIETTLEGTSDYIITQDKHLLEFNSFTDIKIATPKKLLEKCFYRKT